MRGALALADSACMGSNALHPPCLAIIAGARGVFAFGASATFVSQSRSDVGSEDPLNLSISLSVGTETK